MARVRTVRRLRSRAAQRMKGTGAIQPVALVLMVMPRKMPKRMAFFQLSRAGEKAAQARIQAGGEWSVAGGKVGVCEETGLDQ